MVNKLVVSTLIMSILFLSGCAGWNTTYQQMGKYKNESELNSNSILPEHVDVYVQEYPEGFHYDEGIVSVVEGYDYEILGEAKVEFKPVNIPAFMIAGILTFGIASYPMMTPPKMTKDKAVDLLRMKTAEMGGNAIIGVKLPSGSNKQEGASGIVVYIPAES